MIQAFFPLLSYHAQRKKYFDTMIYEIRSKNDNVQLSECHQNSISCVYFVTDDFLGKIAQVIQVVLCTSNHCPFDSVVKRLAHVVA